MSEKERERRKRPAERERERERERENIFGLMNLICEETEKELIIKREYAGKVQIKEAED